VVAATAGGYRGGSFAAGLLNRGAAAKALGRSGAQSPHGMREANAVRVGIDVGGTFTDIVATKADGTLLRLKVASTPRAPEVGALTALAELLASGDVRGDNVAFVAHASTIATNALLGQLALELPRVAFITTEGFRDVLEIGRQNRSAIYDLLVRRPPPLARREDRLTVRERREFDGRVSLALDKESVERAIDAIAERGITSVAIGLLHSYVNDAHETAIAERLAARLPEVHVTRSAVLVREFREYERFSTAVVNAALLPVVGAYLDRLVRGVRARGVAAPVFVMQSDGGMASVDVAARRPASLIESGPAGGVIAAAHLGRTLGIERILSFDMGGTTAKAGTIVGGTPEIAHEFEAAGASHSGRAQKGSGYPVRFPFVDLAEVSAGGGTIAWLDAAGVLRSGPLSAGADPGPACYGKGAQPTVTDANVILGRLDPHALLGGTFPIDAARARRAIASVASVTGGDVTQAAAGIVALVDADMAKVLRIVSVERGYDPREFTLLAFGGGGPLHACAVAREIGVRTIVVPALPGVFSAYGLLAADVRIALSRSVVVAAGDDAWPIVEDVLRELHVAGDAILAEQDVEPPVRAFVRELDLRYSGQSFELTVSAAAGAAGVLECFHANHERRYGFATPDEPVEIVTARVIAVGASPKAQAADSGFDAAAEATGTPAPREWRAAWNGGEFLRTPVYAREFLSAGSAFAGPAVVEQYDATTYIAPGWNARVDAAGNLIIVDSLGPEQAHA
jgi:N-methylhydantoinase A